MGLGIQVTLPEGAQHTLMGRSDAADLMTDIQLMDLGIM
jgi:hypothetical protein